ncbi:hypothetical protein JW960_22100 [candidate division KSB1 bacterium]|nr:hypothetical protein [candidate division KSB1 bacterium]
MDDEIDGFYLDDGTKINPNLVPKPGLCVTCANDDDAIEPELCILTRIDQMEDNDFKCYAYEPKRSY